MYFSIHFADVHRCTPSNQKGHYKKSVVDPIFKVIFDSSFNYFKKH